MIQVQQDHLLLTIRGMLAARRLVTKGFASSPLFVNGNFKALFEAIEQEQVGLWTV